MQVKSIAEYLSLSTFIKLHVPFVIKIFILSIFEWPFYTSLTVVVFVQKMLPASYMYACCILYYSKTCLKGPLINRQNKGLNDKW